MGDDNCVSEVTSAISRIKLLSSEEKRITSSISEENISSSSPHKILPGPKRSNSLSCSEDERRCLGSPTVSSLGVGLPSNYLTDSIRLRMINSHVHNPSNDSSKQSNFKIPIVGYEIMEERARFTVYKLRIENLTSGDCWFVFRRYTDFVRLFSKLKDDFPSIRLSLPRKRWFGDNFNPNFLEERIQGLQNFVNSILQHQELCNSSSIKDFFCLNEPPSYVESMEESRAVFESLEETIYHLRCQLKEKELLLDKMRSSGLESNQKEALLEFFRNSVKDCSKCSKELSKLTLPCSTSTPVKDKETRVVEDTTVASNQVLCDGGNGEPTIGH